MEYTICTSAWSDTAEGDSENDRYPENRAALKENVRAQHLTQTLLYGDESVSTTSETVGVSKVRTLGLSRTVIVAEY